MLSHLVQDFLFSGGGSASKKGPTTSFVSNGDVEVGFTPETMGIQSAVCSTTGADIKYDRRMASVACPAHCQDDPAATGNFVFVF